MNRIIQMAVVVVGLLVVTGCATPRTEHHLQTRHIETQITDGKVVDQHVTTHEVDEVNIGPTQRSNPPVESGANTSRSGASWFVLPYSGRYYNYGGYAPIPSPTVKIYGYDKHGPYKSGSPNNQWGQAPCPKKK
jgi:hypothetical protein